MKTIKLLLIFLISTIIGYALSVKFIFVIPGQSITYIVGVFIAIIIGLIAVIIANIFLKRSSCLENKLNELKVMKERGVITENEYQNMRKKLIDKY